MPHLPRESTREATHPQLTVCSVTFISSWLPRTCLDRPQFGVMYTGKCAVLDRLVIMKGSTVGWIRLARSITKCEPITWRLWSNMLRKGVSWKLTAIFPIQFRTNYKRKSITEWVNDRNLSTLPLGRCGLQSTLMLARPSRISHQKAPIVVRRQKL